MDFQGTAYSPSEGTYYDRPSTKPLSSQVRDVLEGIRSYRRARGEGFLEIRPFLGIDTRHYSLEELAVYLETAFGDFERGGPEQRAAASSRTFAAMRDYDDSSPPPGCFAGVKVYPPLGFDPWPDAGVEREKVEMLWSFCQERDIPIVTHCDDQGFRVASLEESWRFSSPLRWEAALRSYPDLRLDFAHFGMQYSHSIARFASTEWTDRIVRLMVDFPNVYADFSFNGTEPEYYRWLETYLGKRSGALASHIEDRLLFGSDFMVNLSKVRSYADYFRIYEKSPFSDALRARFGHDNPERFLFGA
jgi:hypothetical protein